MEMEKQTGREWRSRQKSESLRAATRNQRFYLSGRELRELPRTHLFWGGSQNSVLQVLVSIGKGKELKQKATDVLVMSPKAYSSLLIGGLLLTGK